MLEEVRGVPTLDITEVLGPRMYGKQGGEL